MSAAGAKSRPDSRPDDAAGPALSRLDTVLQQLLRSRRTAALSTLSEVGEPAVSLVPFAADAAGGGLLVFVSGLAAHTQQLRHHPCASMLVHEAEDSAEHVHALSRVAMEVVARFLPAGGAEAAHAAEVYFSRFPDARMLATLPDFVWVCLTPLRARQVAGFGAARSIEGPRLLELLNQT